MSFVEESPAFSSSVSNLSASSSSAIHPNARSNNRSPRMSATPGSSAGALASASGITRSFDQSQGSFGSHSQRRPSDDPAFNSESIPGADSAEKVPRTVKSVAPIDGGILGAIRAGSDIAPRDDAAADQLPTGSKNVRPLSPQGEVGSGGVLDESGRRVGLFSPSGSSAPRPIFKEAQQRPAASQSAGRAGGRAWNVTDTRSAGKAGLSSSNRRISVTDKDVEEAIVSATSVDSGDDAGAAVSGGRGASGAAPASSGAVKITQRDIENAIAFVESEGEEDERVGDSQKEGEARRARAVQRRDAKLEVLRLRAEDSLMGGSGEKDGRERMAAPCTSVSSTRGGAPTRTTETVSESGSGRRSQKLPISGKIEVSQREIDAAITPAVSEETEDTKEQSGADSLLSPVVVQTGARTPASSSSVSEAGRTSKRDSGANGRTELEVAAEKSMTARRASGGGVEGGLTPLMEESKLARGRQGHLDEGAERSRPSSRSSVLNYNNEGVVIEEDPGAWAADAAAGGRAGVASPQWVLENVEADANELEASSSAGISSRANTSMSTSMHSVSLPTSAGVAEVSTAETHNGRPQKACEAGVCEVVDRLTLAGKAKRKLFGTKTSRTLRAEGRTPSDRAAVDAPERFTSPVEVNANAPPAPTGVVSPTGIPFLSFKRGTSSAAEGPLGGSGDGAKGSTNAQRGGASGKLFGSGDSGPTADTSAPTDGVAAEATSMPAGKSLKDKISDQVSGIASRFLPQKAQQDAACVIDDTSEALFGNSAGVEGSVEEKAKYAASRNGCPSRQMGEAGVPSAKPALGEAKGEGEMGDDADAMRSDIARGLSETAEAVKSNVKGTAEDVRTKVEGVRETVEHLAEDAKGRLQQAAQLIKSKLPTRRGSSAEGVAEGEEGDGARAEPRTEGSSDGPSASAGERISRTATTTATAMAQAAEGAVSKVTSTVQQKQQQLQKEGVGAVIKGTVSGIKASVAENMGARSSAPGAGLEAGEDASGEKVVVYGLGAEASNTSRSPASPLSRPAVPSSTTA